MRAVLCKRWGGPGELTVEDVEPPQLTEGGVRIAVYAAGLNFADTLAIQGKYQTRGTHPFSPGLEGAGEVIEVAPGVTRVKCGDRVVFHGELGAWAEEVVFRESQVWPIPRSLDWCTAAGFSIVYLTSLLGLDDRARLRAGEWLLVHGAGGGVGLTAVELGAILGARVIASASSPSKLELARRRGAAHLIDSRGGALRQQIKAITQGHGCDVVYDPVGGDAFDESLHSVAWNARIITLGFASGRIPLAPCNLLLVKQIAVLGHYLGSYRIHAPELVDSAMQRLLGWYESHTIHPHVSHIFPMNKVTVALETLLARKSAGKIVLELRD